MTPNNDLLALAERCEASDGADRELDALIWCALNGKRYVGHFPAYAPYGANNPETQVEYKDPGRRSSQVTGAYGTKHAQPWTSSLDAALTLVPEGWTRGSLHWPGYSSGEFIASAKAELHHEISSGGHPKVSAYAATPALALTAAALKARALAQTEGR